MSICGFLANAKKAVASAVGVALTVLLFAGQVPFLPSAWAGVIGTVVAVLTPIATWFASGPKA
jgi:Na+-translocating ferredoxin:NAD+ oxidoreductase RnfD subunit